MGSGLNSQNAEVSGLLGTLVLDTEGLHTLPDKQEAIKQVPARTNVQQVRSFLGLVKPVAS